MAPSKNFGWTFPPNKEFTYTGRGWYSREFSTKNKINSLGFRDLERKYNKPEETIRIALLGASMIAGKESDFKDTIGQILKRKLNKVFKNVCRRNKCSFKISYMVSGEAFLTTPNDTTYMI